MRNLVRDLKVHFVFMLKTTILREMEGEMSLTWMNRWHAVKVVVVIAVTIEYLKWLQVLILKLHWNLWCARKSIECGGAWLHDEISSSLETSLAFSLRKASRSGLG